MVIRKFPAKTCRFGVCRVRSTTHPIRRYCGVSVIINGTCFQIVINRMMVKHRGMVGR